MKARCFLAVLLTLSAAGAAAQGVYRWTDERGKVHYGSQAPPSSKAIHNGEVMRGFSVASFEALLARTAGR